MPENKPGVGVVDTTKSPHARLRPVPPSAVRWGEGFWKRQVDVNRERTIPHGHRMLNEVGNVDNFRRASGRKKQDYRGPLFMDSDLYKWLEAAAFSLGTDPDAELEGKADAIIEEIAAAQGDDGYIDTWFTFEREGERWGDLARAHELYCAGHLFQAAVAHKRATGKSDLLDVATRFADYLCEYFGPGRHAGTSGHPEIEMALVEMYRETGRKDYLDLARFFIDERGGEPPRAGGREYNLDHRPFRELEEIAGHAVRAVYLCAGATDLYAETGEAALLDVLERLWRDMMTKTYVTGGIGSRHHGEAFGEPFELPNARAYAETCAAIGSVMWNWRMLQLKGEARFADAAETALYNGFLSGVSLDGESFFYQNPLADPGKHRRRGWFGCACCPPNVARMLASLAGHLYGTSDEGVWVHLYDSNELDWRLSDGRRFKLTQETRYPWEGEVDLTLSVEEGDEFSLFLRIPGWCDAAKVSVHGSPAVIAPRPGEYVEFRRPWKDGDRVTLKLSMPPRLVECDPRVAENSDRRAIARGPLVYCLEGADNPGADVRTTEVDPDAELKTEFEPGLLGGVAVVSGGAFSPDPGGWENRLYRRATKAAKRAGRSLEFRAVPYYARANREPGAMQVWLRAARGGE